MRESHKSRVMNGLVFPYSVSIVDLLARSMSAIVKNVRKRRNSNKFLSRKTTIPFSSVGSS